MSASTTMSNPAMKETAKAIVMKPLSTVFEGLGATMVGNTAYIPTDVQGQRIFVEVKVTAKNWYDTKTSLACDPEEILREYNEEKAAAAAKKAETAAKRAAKAEADKAARAKRKAEAEAKAEAKDE